ncbi:MAG: hypothetical protein AAFX46_04060 [Cyanobacteria bacterium J06636_27]
MQEFTKKLAENIFNISVILDKYFQLQKLGLLSRPSFCSFVMVWTKIILAKKSIYDVNSHQLMLQLMTFPVSGCTKLIVSLRATALAQRVR